MKPRIILLLTLLFIFTTCGTDVKFENPQPLGGKNLKYIPKTYYGRYKALKDSTLIIIDSISINKLWKSNEYMHRDSLEKELKVSIKKDTVIVMKDQFLHDQNSKTLTISIKVIKDSTRVMFKGYETLFEVSDSQIVRTFKDYCLLNFKTKDGYWLVKTLKKNNLGLDFSDLINSKDVENFGSIIKVTAIKDTADKVVEYRINPTKRELKKILRIRKIDIGYIKI
ncbi:MAG TPA: hypothetical protein DIW31_12430 [Bacteroidales bacterium]|nr:hypothetical protein [Bacteroidales bacterium]